MNINPFLNITPSQPSLPKVDYYTSKDTSFKERVNADFDRQRISDLQNKAYDKIQDTKSKNENYQKKIDAKKENQDENEIDLDALEEADHDPFFDFITENIVQDKVSEDVTVTADQDHKKTIKLENDLTFLQSIQSLNFIQNTQETAKQGAADLFASKSDIESIAVTSPFDTVPRDEVLSHIESLLRQNVKGAEKQDVFLKLITVSATPAELQSLAKQMEAALGDKSTDNINALFTKIYKSLDQNVDLVNAPQKPLLTPQTQMETQQTGFQQIQESLKRNMPLPANQNIEAQDKKDEQVLLNDIAYADSDPSLLESDHSKTQSRFLKFMQNLQQAYTNGTTQQNQIFGAQSSSSSLSAANKAIPVAANSVGIVADQAVLTQGDVTQSADWLAGRDVPSLNGAHGLTVLSGLVTQTRQVGQAHPATQMVAVQLHKTAKNAQGESKLSLDLDPPELGRVEIQLRVKDDNVKALVRVESTETYMMLQRDSYALERALQDAGLEVAKDGITFELAQQDSSFDSQGDGQNQKQEHGTGYSTLWDDPSEANDVMLTKMDKITGQTKNNWYLDSNTGLTRYNNYI
jgi:flagellar hook-length control protein FliK